MKYKILISEIIEKEVPTTEYRNTHKKDENEKDIWEDVEIGGTTLEREERAIYEQTLEDLDIRDVAIYINRIK